MPAGWRPRLRPSATFTRWTITCWRADSANGWGAILAEQALLGSRRLHRFGLAELPACGTPVEVLRHHRLDGASLATEVLRQQGRAAGAAAEQVAVYNTLEAAQ